MFLVLSRRTDGRQLITNGLFYVGLPKTGEIEGQPEKCTGRRLDLAEVHERARADLLDDLGRHG
jgi:hypothetical protein